MTKGVMRPVRIPNADRSWHPIARRLWDALKFSGQSDFYQDSDWAFAYSLREDLSAYKKSNKRSGPDAPDDLLGLRAAARRRVRIELHEPAPETASAAVLAIASYKKELGLSK
ncbi:hypothetical protein [Kitasatospora sp. NPDC057198]|uniref:phage terminase small subunit n=1 Tax=Kitasatospora sp. NPDC057198 TaxID=3346046 RepID=UPI0036382C06